MGRKLLTWKTFSINRQQMTVVGGDDRIRWQTMMHNYLSLSLSMFLKQAVKNEIYMRIWWKIPSKFKKFSNGILTKFFHWKIQKFSICPPFNQGSNFLIFSDENVVGMSDSDRFQQECKFVKTSIWVLVSLPESIGVPLEILTKLFLIRIFHRNKADF